MSAHRSRATTARFRVRHERALADIFTQVLVLCARAGLVSVGLVAIDGSLIAGNASPQATKTYAAIRKGVEVILEQAAQADAADDERFGEARGDELPPELADRRSRRERLRRCRQELEAEQAAEQAAHQANLAWRADWEAEHGRKLGGRKPTPPDPDALARRTINTTDPDTRLMKRAGGRSVQGNNVQAGAGDPRRQVTQAHNDSDQLAPMVDQATAALTAAGIDQPIGTVLADGGYWNSPQITDVRARGIDVLVPTKNAKRTEPRRLSPRQGDEAERIEQILDSDQGRALYRRRQQIVEPVFAHTKFLRRIDRFQRRGPARALTLRRRQQAFAQDVAAGVATAGAQARVQPTWAAGAAAVPPRRQRADRPDVAQRQPWTRRLAPTA
jgi:hypothetical protein